jgi:Bacterial PH domain
MSGAPADPPKPDGRRRRLRRRAFDVPLVPGEQVVWQARPHWTAVAGPALTVAAALGAAALFIPWLALLAVPAVPTLARRAAAYRATRLVLTDARFIARFGNFHPQVHSRALVDLEGVGFEQGPWGMLLSYGSVIVYDRHGGRERFSHVAGGRELARRADGWLLARAAGSSASAQPHDETWAAVRRSG